MKSIWKCKEVSLEQALQESYYWWVRGGKQDPRKQKQTCEFCGMSNIYQQCSKCIDWKLPLQEKPSYK